MESPKNAKRLYQLFTVFMKVCKEDGLAIDNLSYERFVKNIGKFLGEEEYVCTPEDRQYIENIMFEGFFARNKKKGN